MTVSVERPLIALDYQGITPFRRAVEIRYLGDNGAEAEMEDDHHHFRVHVHAMAGKISEIEGIAVRRSWTLCALAAEKLNLLVGAPVSPDPTAIQREANIREQCTHMFDQAGLEVAAIARQGPRLRRYDMTIIPCSPERWFAELKRDDGWTMNWICAVDRIEQPYGPGPISLKSTFVNWAHAYFDEEGFEAAIILRRAFFVGKFRHLHNLDDRASAADIRANMGGCFVLQPDRADKAKQMKGATTRFPLPDRPPLVPQAVEIGERS